MAKPVYVPELGRVLNFSDEATDDQIVSEIRSMIPSAPAPDAPPPAPDESTFLGRFSYGLAKNLTDIPGGIVSLYTPAERVSSTAAGRFSEESRKYLQEKLGVDPTKDPTATQQAAEALGSVAAYLIPSTGAAKVASLLGRGTRAAGAVADILAAERAAKIAGTATAAAQGVALGASAREQKIQQQLAAGMEISPEAQLAAQQLDGLIGIAEAAPLGRFFGPIAKLLEKVPVSKASIVEKIIQNRLSKVFRAGGAEAVQEAASGIANDIVEYGVYNPDVQIGDDLLSNAGTGAFAGSFVEGVIQVAAGRKLRPYRQLQQDRAAEKSSRIAEARQSIISRGSEDLRSANIDGPVEIVEDDFDGIKSFRVKTGAGELIGEFPDKDTAIESISLYNQRTGAKVEPREPVKIVPPSVLPIKIGNKKFKDVSEIEAARDSLGLKIEAAKVSISDPAILEARAKDVKMSQALYRKRVQGEINSLSKEYKKYDDFLNSEAEAKKREEDFGKYFGVGAEPIPAPPTPPQPPIAGPGVWASKDYDIPVTILDEPAQSGSDGILYRRVRQDDGKESYAPQAELKSIQEPLEAVGAVEPTPPIGVAETAPAPPEGGISAIPDQVGAQPQPEAQPIQAPIRVSPMAAAKTPRAYTPEESDRRVAIKEGLARSVAPIVPDRLRLEIADSASLDRAGVAVRGRAIATRTPEGVDSLIEFSIDHMKPGMTVEEAVLKLADTINHEIIHVVRDKGLLRSSEWGILSRAAANTKIPGKSYTYLDKAEAVYTPELDPLYADADAVLEEAVADMYRDWVKNKNAPPPTRGLFNRITEFFRRIFRLVRNTHHESVFRAIQSGEVGARTDITPREPVVSRFDAVPQGLESRPRLSAVQLPDYLELKNRTLLAPDPKRSVLDVMKESLFGGSFLNLGEQGRTYESPTFARREVTRGERWRLANRQSLVDNTAVVRFIEEIVNEQRTGNRQRETSAMSASVSLMRQRYAGRTNLEMLKRGRYDVRFARPGDYQSIEVVPVEDADKMADVFTVINEPGPIDPVTGEQKKKAVVFTDYAIAKRGARFKAEGRPIPREIDQRFIDTAISFAEREYPEVVEAYEKYQRINKNLIKTALDTGFITQKEFTDYTKQMDYYGFYREMYEEPIIPGVPGKVAGKIDVRAYKGSEFGGLVNDPMFVIMANTKFWTNAILKNIATKKTFELAKTVGEARLLGTGEKPDRDSGEDPEVMFFKENGVLKRFAVKDRMLVEALGSDTRTDIGAALEILGMPAKWLRESVTRDPIFSIFNLFRDTLSSWMNSGEDFRPVIDSFKGMATALKQGPSYRALMAYGSIGSYDVGDFDLKSSAKKLARMYTPSNVHTITTPEAGLRIFQTLWDRAGVLSDASDAATRIAIFDAAIKAGENESEAATRALEIMDFGRHGTNQLLAALVKLIPFLNARIQGLDVLYQAGSAGARFLAGKSRGERDANIGKKFLVRGALLAAISLALERWNEDDEEYQQIEDYVKNSNLLVSLKMFGLPGQFLAYPKPFENGLIFSTLPQQMYKTLNGDATTRDNFNLFIGSFSSTFGISPLPQFLIPAVEVMTGWNFYTGEPLMSAGTASLVPELQYTKSTSQFAIMIGRLPVFYDMDTGKFGSASPVNIDKLISGYGGPLGTYLTQGIGLLMEGLDIGPDRLPRKFSEAPGIRRIFIDAEGRNPKVASQAYDLGGVVDEISRSYNRLKQIGDAEALANFVEENRKALSYRKTVFKILDGLNKITAQERRIAQDPSMSREEKFEAMQSLRQAKIRISSQVSAINEALGR